MVSTLQFKSLAREDFIGGSRDEIFTLYIDIYFLT